MTPENFFNLVRDMRLAQREYFRTRSLSVLTRAKALEKRVDDEIERIANPDKAAVSELNLFAPPAAE